MVISSIFPPGTPVWYNFQCEFNNNSIIRVYEGVVRSMSLSNTTQKQSVYEVLRNKNVLENGVKVVLVDSVDENNIAYGSQCPVHVKMIADDTSSKEMNGEILSSCFVGNSKQGTSVVTYRVKMLSDDGEMLIEENVSADRVRYRFGLDQLRAKLNEDSTNSTSSTSIGIRLSSVGLPLRRVRRKCKQCQIKETVGLKCFSLDETKNINSNNRLHINKQSIAPSKSAPDATNQSLCVRENCNFHGQDSCGGYCYAHFHQLCLSRKKE